MFSLTGTIAAMFCSYVRREEYGYKGCYIVIGNKGNVPPASTVTTVRPAKGNEFLASEACTSVTAVASFSVQNNGVYKFI
jgi:hypothetical protein